MPPDGKISNEIYAASYQGFDGSNTSIVLGNLNGKIGENAALSCGAGFFTDFKNNSGFMLEGKVKYDIGCGFNGQLRLRSFNGEDYNTTQIRLSAGYSKDAGKGFSVYGNIYEAAKANYNKGKVTFDSGCFAGVSKDFGKISAFVEIQPHFKGSQCEVNGGIAYKLNK